MLYGVDASSHQKQLSLAESQARDFVIIKVTGGTWYENDIVDGVPDGTWLTQLAQARGLGHLVGFYHYAFEGGVPSDPKKEAKFFVSKVQPVLQPGDVVALDFEEPKVQGTNLAQWALTWLQTVEEALGFRPLFYSFPSYITECGLNDQRLAAYPLWLASYYTPYKDYPWPRVPAAWQRISLWQYGGGSLSDPWDRNIFDGTREQFLDLGKPRLILPQEKPVSPVPEGTLPPVIITPSLNSKGETIVTLNFGGFADEVVGVNVQDVGVSVRHGSEFWDRSVLRNESQRWIKR